MDTGNTVYRELVHVCVTGTVFIHQLTEEYKKILVEKQNLFSSPDKTHVCSLFKHNTNGNGNVCTCRIHRTQCKSVHCLISTFLLKSRHYQSKSKIR